jgi:hypothetical protein
MNNVTALPTAETDMGTSRRSHLLLLSGAERRLQAVFQTKDETYAPERGI